MNRHYTPAGYRTIRAGTNLVATEYRRADGSTVQMAGQGDEVERALREAPKLLATTPAEA